MQHETANSVINTTLSNSHKHISSSEPLAGDSSSSNATEEVLSLVTRPVPESLIAASPTSPYGISLLPSYVPQNSIVSLGIPFPTNTMPLITNLLSGGPQLTNTSATSPLQHQGTPSTLAIATCLTPGSTSSTSSEVALMLGARGLPATFFPHPGLPAPRKGNLSNVTYHEEGRVAAEYYQSPSNNEDVFSPAGEHTFHHAQSLRRDPKSLSENGKSACKASGEFKNASTNELTHGWLTLEGLKVPYIVRGGMHRLLPLCVVEKLFLVHHPGPYPENLINRQPMACFYLATQEVRQLNRFVAQTYMQQLGLSRFSLKDMLVGASDFWDFYQCVKRAVPHQSVPLPVQVNKPQPILQGGWSQINNTVVPYVLRGRVKLVPLSVVRYAAGLLEETAVDTLKCLETECVYLNEACTSVGLSFKFTTETQMIELFLIPTLCKSRVNIRELPKKSPLSHARYVMFNKDRRSVFVAASVQSKMDNKLKEEGASVKGDDRNPGSHTEKRSIADAFAVLPGANSKRFKTSTKTSDEEHPSYHLSNDDSPTCIDIEHGNAREDRKDSLERLVPTQESKPDKEGVLYMPIEIVPQDDLKQLTSSSNESSQSTWTQMIQTANDLNDQPHSKMMPTLASESDEAKVSIEPQLPGSDDDHLATYILPNFKSEYLNSDPGTITDNIPELIPETTRTLRHPLEEDIKIPYSINEPDDVLVIDDEPFTRNLQNAPDTLDLTTDRPSSSSPPQLTAKYDVQS